MSSRVSTYTAAGTDAAGSGTRDTVLTGMSRISCRLIRFKSCVAGVCADAAAATHNHTVMAASTNLDDDIEAAASVAD